MNADFAGFLEILPGALPPCVRVATAMMLMPGLGELAIPVIGHLQKPLDRRLIV